MKNSQNNFIIEYKRLEAILKKISGAKDSTKLPDIIDLLSSKNYLIKSKRGILLDLSALRNIFQHSDREKYIAQINNIAFLEIKKIINLLKNPPRAGDVFRKHVYKVNENEITEIILNEMKRNKYTHVPIYRSDKYLGCFSESTLFEWLIENIEDGRAGFYKKQIKNIKREYLFPKNNITSFISAKTSIFEIQSMFDVAIKKQQRLGALIITNSGKKDDEPIGIITAWDLPLIDNYLESN